MKTNNKEHEDKIQRAAEVEAELTIRHLSGFMDSVRVNEDELFELLIEAFKKGATYQTPPTAPGDLSKRLPSRQYKRIEHDDY